MSDRDELLRKQQEEIDRLKKELKEATKPTSLFTTLKKSVKRNIHEFFNREDRMKSMDAEIKDLRKKLADAEEEKARQEAILFASMQEPLSEKDMAKSSEASGFELPKTPEEVLKKFFGPCDIDTYIKTIHKASIPEDKTIEEQTTSSDQPDPMPSSEIIRNIGPRTNNPTVASDSVPARTKPVRHAEAPVSENASVPVVPSPQKNSMPSTTQTMNKEATNNPAATAGSAPASAEAPGRQTFLSAQPDPMPSAKSAIRNKDTKDNNPTVTTGFVPESSKTAERAEAPVSAIASVPVASSPQKNSMPSTTPTVNKQTTSNPAATADSVPARTKPVKRAEAPAHTEARGRQSLPSAQPTPTPSAKSAIRNKDTRTNKPTVATGFVPESSKTAERTEVPASAKVSVPVAPSPQKNSMPSTTPTMNKQTISNPAVTADSVPARTKTVKRAEDPVSAGMHNQPVHNTQPVSPSEANKFSKSLPSNNKQRKYKKVMNNEQKTQSLSVPANNTNKKELPYKGSRSIQGKSEVKNEKERTPVSHRQADIQKPTQEMEPQDITYDLVTTPKDVPDAGSESNHPEIYMGYVEEPVVTPPPIAALGSVFDEDDDFDDDLL